MKRHHVWLGLWATGFGCATPEVGGVVSEVVYDQDDRLEFFEQAPGVHRDLAETVVAMKVRASALDESDPNDIRWDYTRTLREAQRLCDGERYSDQIDPGSCSGTLIDAEHLLTAGHCMDSARDCSDSQRWVFGFRMVAEDTLAPMTVDDVYRCAEVVVAEEQGEIDYAVVRLDRPVVGRMPAPVRVAAGGLGVGLPLTMIGHPNGIPMKIAGGATVTDDHVEEGWLESDLDAFSGNSGSGVFDDAGNLVALLQSGATDYVASGDCNVVNTIRSRPGRGENLTYVAPALEAFCDQPGLTSVACACDGPCVEADPGDTCEDAVLVPASDQTLDIDFTQHSGSERGSCGGQGAEKVFSFALTVPTLVLVESSDWDSVLYLREGCDGEEVDCNDDLIRGQIRTSRLVRTLDPGTYVLFADSFDADRGRGTVSLSFEPFASPSPRDGGSGFADAGPGEDTLPDVTAMMPAPEDGGCRARSPRAMRSEATTLLLFLLAFVSRRPRSPH